MPAPLTFEIHHTDSTPGSRARTGTVTTPHGSFATPAFMPVGTQAAMKGMTVDQVDSIGAEIILSNTYHLMLRPGSELIAASGGLHGFMKWPKPILTDSGGFQVFSLGDINQINDDGVIFKSHLDGSKIEMTPEVSMQVQNQLGADIIMAFDDCPPAAEESSHQKERAKIFGPNTSRKNLKKKIDIPYEERVRLANERTIRWLDRCVKAHGRKDEQALFPIVQGGTDLAQRDWCVEQICQFDTPGYAIGGVAVGEPPEEIAKVVAHTAPKLPTDKPRYLMGVGYERDIVRAVRAGVDMFDCVMPARNARNGSAMTPTGQIRLKNAKFKNDHRPICEDCDCPACAGPALGGAPGTPGSPESPERPSGGSGGGGYSRAYLRHLFHAGEMLGPILVSLHNLRHMARFMADLRATVASGDWAGFAVRWPVAELEV